MELLTCRAFPHPYARDSPNKDNNKIGDEFEREKSVLRIFLSAMKIQKFDYFYNRLLFIIKEFLSPRLMRDLERLIQFVKDF